MCCHPKIQINPNNQSSEGTSEQNPSRGDTGNREDNSANGTITENDTIIIEGYEFPVYDMNSLPQPTENAKTKLVAIDIGHGGQDAGATGHKGQADAIDEKDLTLAAGARCPRLSQISGNTGIYGKRNRLLHRSEGTCLYGK